MQNNINIKNKRARFEFELIEEYTAGIVLTGTEIKSIRNSKASITESFCEFNERGELFTVNMHIEEYAFGTRFNHRPKAQRKLLLNKKELAEIFRATQQKGLTCIPTKLFWKKELVKCEIALASGRKSQDKRENIKSRDWDRQKAKELRERTKN